MAFTKDEARQYGRDMLTKNVVEHERKHGRQITEAEARKYANARADLQDRKKDLGENK